MSLAATLKQKRIDEAPWHTARSMPNRAAPPAAEMSRALMATTFVTPASGTVTSNFAAPSIPTPVSPNPNGKVDFLHKLGQWFREKFTPIATVVVKDATIAAEVAEPVIDVAVPALAGIYHSTLQTVVSLEGIAGSSNGTGAQKMASAVSQLAPILIPYLQQLGVSNPNTAMIEAYIQSVVDGLKKLQVETSTPSAPAQ